MATQRSTDNIDIPNRREGTWSQAPNGYAPAAFNQSYVANATVNAYRAVKFDGTTGRVIQGAAATDLTIGVNQSPQAALLNQETMIAHIGLGKIELGGTVAAGDLLTSDTVGRAVTSLAAPTDRVIGVALGAGGTGTVIPVLIVPSKNGGVT